MKTYQVTYSVCTGGAIEIDANSEMEAEELFDQLDLDDLFETKDLYRGIEIEEIEEVS